jgi:hypothetical protein
MRLQTGAEGHGHDFARINLLSGSRDEVFARGVPWRVSARPHGTLPAGTPAWTEDGVVTIGEQALLAPPAKRADILRHEAIHSLHQRAARRDESAAARDHAERLATDPRAVAKLQSLPPAPALLAFPPQKHKSFDQVWIGHDGIIGEVVADSVTVRTLLAYKEMGIDPLAVNPAKDFHCGPNNMAPIPDRAKAMSHVAIQTAKDNKNLPAGMSKQIARLVLVAKEPSAYRVAGKDAVIVIDEGELAGKQYVDTLAHETSHAIFEFHSAGQSSPDAYALQIADVFNRAQKTNSVPHPLAKFDPKSPPPLTLKDGTGVAAAIAMVSDTLWAGSGGHPGDGPDEFFASAYGGSLRAPALQKQIFKHYAGADPNVETIGKELLTLLSIVTNPKAMKGLKPPSDKAALAAAEKTIQGQKATPDITQGSGVLPMLADPTKMPGPEKIKC